MLSFFLSGYDRGDSTYYNYNEVSGSTLLWYNDLTKCFRSLKLNEDSVSFLRVSGNLIWWQLQSIVQMDTLFTIGCHDFVEGIYLYKNNLKTGNLISRFCSSSAVVNPIFANATKEGFISE